MNRLNVLLYIFNTITCFSAQNVDFPNKRIIGGDDAKDGQFKYQISLEAFGMVLCSGAIIAEKYALIAAHCVINIVDSVNNTSGFGFINYPYKVTAGTTDLEDDKGDSVSVDVEKIYVPKDFDRNKLINDIAVLKLKHRFHLKRNSNLGKVKLPQDNYTYAGEIAKISGYGYISIETRYDKEDNKTYEYGGYSDYQLKYAEVEIIDNDECKRINRYHPQIISTNICGYVIQRGEKHEGVCSGDSGGPLVFENTVVGILSNSPVGCTEHEQPATYTRVSYFVPLIHDVLIGNTNDTYVYTVGEHEVPLWPSPSE